MSALLKLTLKAERCAVHPNRSCTEQLWTCEHDITYPGTIKSVLSMLMLIVGRATTTTLCFCSIQYSRRQAALVREQVVGICAKPMDMVLLMRGLNV